MHDARCRICEWYEIFGYASINIQGEKVICTTDLNTEAMNFI